MTAHRLLTYFIVAVWLANGLACKVLGLVPRHEQIVGRILGEGFSKPLTILIGIAEIGMAVWVLKRWMPRTNAVVQMLLIATMNTLEFFMASDLLFWGQMNAVFAALFIGLIYYWEFILRNDI